MLFMSRQMVERTLEQSYLWRLIEPRNPEHSSWIFYEQVDRPLRLI
jgi:hypothetical protein